MEPFSSVAVNDLLVQAMKTAEISHRVLASNIANADTPHFNPTHLNFQKTLRAMVEGRGGFDLRTSRPRHLGFTGNSPQFERLAFLSKNDYNKVDLDEEMVKLSENTGKYTTYARLLTKRFSMYSDMLSSLQR